MVSGKDGSTDLILLKDLKESNPVKVAEYAVSNKIAEEFSFAWWVQDMLCCRDQVIKKVKSTKYWLVLHKDGVKLTKTMAEALVIDLRTRTTFCWDAIEKEMSWWHLSKVAKETCHMIVFDIKLDLTRKARQVPNGAKHKNPREVTFVTCRLAQQCLDCFLSCSSEWTWQFGGRHPVLLLLDWSSRPI